MITDIHTHIYSEKDYKNYFDKAKGRVAKALVLDYKIRTPGLSKLIKFSQQKKNLFVLASVDMDKNISQQLKKLETHFKKKEIIGIKLYPGYEHFYPSDKKVWPIAKLCAKYNQPLVFHSGDFYDPDNIALLKYSRPIYIDELATKVPKCKIVISHFGFPYFMETAMVISKNANVYTDISGTIEVSDTKQEAIDLLEQYKKDLIRVFNYYPNIKPRVLFATDYGGEHTPLNLIDPYIDLVKKVFNKKEQKLVFTDLAEKLYFNK